ncbi:MAG: type II toxin-antitoxin system Phd/YefM family antitoxin [Spirochaetaceae bacterium]|jgi:PHD/YefM family antitoxin component YafN of YafNO toxin-antitoxin module|nr:type II toxin-antitoxin system Phd/YefM family antitoxin [Spirochaetaceae bacterium]
MPAIRPITELRKTNEISEFCHSVHEPVYITKNGYGDMVIMGIEVWEKQQQMFDVYNKLHEAELALENGAKPKSADEVFKKFREKYKYA